jgi:hypothetical protein
MTSRSSAANAWCRRAARATRSRNAFGFCAAACSIRTVRFGVPHRVTPVQRFLARLMLGEELDDVVIVPHVVSRQLVAPVRRFPSFAVRGLQS